MEWILWIHSSIWGFFRNNDNQHPTVTIAQNDFSAAELVTEERSISGKVVSLEEQMSSMQTAMKRLTEEMAAMRNAIAEM